MSSLTNAYAAGSEDALSAFNVRLAFDNGAEWLAKTLEHADDAPDRVGTSASYRKLEKPPIWGSRASLESSTANARNYSGIGAYGGV